MAGQVSLVTPAVLSGVGILESAHRVRRGSVAPRFIVGGVEWMGGPLWNPVWGTGMPAALPWWPGWIHHTIQVCPLSYHLKGDIYGYDQ